jgi:flagellar assembly protein FliH
VSSEGKKYFFDLNNFDGPAVPEPDEDVPPPPPVFSLEEMGQAKQVGFEEGLTKGHQEEKDSRAQYIATQVSELNSQILGLILAEQMREKAFEQEVIHLCRALTSRLFPALNEREGFNEIERVISRVVERQPVSSIHIEVPENDVEDIKRHLSVMKDIEPDRLQILGNATLTKGSCSMKWQDGGAIRNFGALSHEIFKELDEVLAPPAQKVQNSESEPIDTKGEQNG